MLLAVAGLDVDSVKQRTESLAGGDWSKLSRSEQIAFSFARKQAKQPWAVNEEDYQQLAGHFGPHRTVDVIWWACRCHYMTCIADAFQIPLERENVFRRGAPPAEGSEPKQDSDDR